ncbi:patatin-like phospholipase family protein [Alkalicoccus chagannorensis]|uniref:patatin-like phospholipase family protein n=1 Tax=Alkalicoccus chagannorensis TaxID=427072 RepID=UPI000404E285|nr:patatin family protein [Alkalicoccus chagannorensis]
MKHTGLVLEGGGMRGVFTSGVLEYLLENDISFPYVVGVSAGACNAVSYISRQSGRNKAVTVDYAEHPDYISVKRLLRQGELFNMDLIFNQIPNKEEPFNYNRFFSSEQLFYTGVTDCVSGDTVYFEKQELFDDLNKILRASSSLPVVAPVVEHDGRAFMDGGISDPIPIGKSEADGNSRHVIILTQPKGYRKTPARRGMWYFRRKYKDYPGLIRVVENRYRIYNDTLDKIERMEEAGDAVVIRPETLYDVSRTERKKEKLEVLYWHGYEQMKERAEYIAAFVDEKLVK